MIPVINDIDRLLQSAEVRLLNPSNADIILVPSAPAFHLDAAGVADIDSIVVSATLIGLDEAITFSAQGGTLTDITEKTATVTLANMQGRLAVVTATVLSGGEEFSRHCLISTTQDGADGADGGTYYTWIKFADDVAGVGISNDPSGKRYIGFAYNKSSSIESNTPGDYQWSLFAGGDGVPGPKGADGQTLYTWIKYADQPDGTGLYDNPTADTLYIGIAPNRTTAAESTVKTDYIWSRLKGEQGVAGSVTYTWIKYADNAAGGGLADDPTGKAYIGFAYNKSSAIESTTPADYTWSLIKGTDGQPGGTGPSGATFYTWIKYSDAADGTGLYDLPTASTLYIGIATNKSTSTESTVKTDYVWSKFKGDQGVQGPTTYTWVKYADSAAGAGLSDDPTGKTYIGLAYNKPTATESTTATDYAWSLIKGTDGQPGGKGADGQSLYTWIKYSDNADGTDLYDLPTASTLYLGIAVNKATSTESTVKTDYVWSKFRGADGVSVPGSRGAGFYRANGNAWSDATADAATPGGNVVGDIVTISNGTVSYTKEWNGSAWFVNGAFLSGNLFVEKSIGVAQINANGLSIYSPSGTLLFDAGRTLAEQAAVNPNLVSNCRGPWSLYSGVGGNRNGDVRFGDGQYFWFPINNNAAAYCGADSPALGIPANAAYTVSFDAYCTGVTRTLVSDVYVDGGFDSNGITVALTNTLTRYKYTEFAPNVGNSASARLRLFSIGTGGSEIVIANIKVELGSTMTPWCDSVITPFNADVRMSSASIKLAHIDRASIGNLSALVAYLGNVELGTGGAIRQGQWAYDQGVGGFFGADGNGNPALSLRSASGKFLRMNPANDQFETSGQKLFNPDLDNPNVQTSFAITLGDIVITGQPNGSLTTGLTLSYSGGAPARHQWSLSSEGPGLELRGDPTSASPVLYAQGSTRWVYGWVSVTAWSTTGAVDSTSAYVRIQFGNAYEM